MGVGFRSVFHFLSEGRGFGLLSMSANYSSCYGTFNQQIPFYTIKHVKLPLVMQSRYDYLMKLWYGRYWWYGRDKTSKWVVRETFTVILLL